MLITLNDLLYFVTERKMGDVEELCFVINFSFTLCNFWLT